jgi:hypothetical protein
MTEIEDRREPATAPGERRLGVIWDAELVDAAGCWPEQLGLDTCGECDVEDPADLH